jgi:hypothetical protein
VDPLVTGELYAHAGYMRDTYSQRTAHGYPLVEYSSAGGPGDVGVDVGPFGLAEYSGRQGGADDGIPENWALPDTPVRWYRPAAGDYYSPGGVVPYRPGLHALTVPDHEILSN